MSSTSTIKAAVFKGVKPSAPFLSLTQIQAPVAGSGDVVVKILATRVLGYMGEIFNGTRNYPSQLPMVPGSGGIGLIKSVGPGNVHLQVGQMVYIDPTVRARDHPISPQVMLQGLIAVGEAQKMQDVWLNGSWAEEMLVPTENVTVIPPSVQAKFDATQLTSLGNYAVVYGGFVAADFKAGQTVVITGSTGPFGASAVAVALSLGARRVLAIGRNQKQLDDYVARYGSRVVGVASTGDVVKDTQSIKEAAGEGFEIDLAFDILPPSAPFAIVRSVISALRFGGTAVLMGGVQAAVEFPYYELMSRNITIKGNFMYRRDAPT
ncbi:alcohol dehydrogenase zinc-binding domain protein, partial [Dissophora ornata]